MAEADIVAISGFAFIIGLGILLFIVFLAIAFFVGRWWWSKYLKKEDPNPNVMGAIAAVALLVNFWLFLGFFVITYFMARG